ncbi:flocculation protein FLO11-like isoform X1 [Daphnia pulex]|uniref:flocculation protein FLO11-like isoform X1 n=1 Tax=Daphnia pulex TaxID=6669 RepID=UPI001EDFD271|nr:flocculation protein FLO11-like isoform X1 [Daphnia pulex]
MVKARIPGSSQELYTVSVESVPQYAGGNGKRPGCCKSGRVGKDLLCGVLIALAVICAAVAIFLVVFYVVNAGTDEASRAPPSSASDGDQQNGTLDSSPLTRDREEEKKINSLKESHELDSSEAKDQLSLSSTSLPDVGIHEPEFHVKGEAVYPPYKIGGGQQTSSTTENPIQPAEEEKKDDELNPPIDIEANSQEIEGKDQTTLFVPDDDVIIETPSLAANTDSTSGQLQTDPAPPVVLLPESTTTVKTASTISTTVADVDVSSSERTKEITTTAAVVPVPLPDPVVVAVQELETSGFVPVKVQEDLDFDPEQSTDSQTEALPDILSAKPVDPAIDTAPWKPIDATVAIPAVIVNKKEEIQPTGGQKTSSTTTTTTSTTAKTIVTSPSGSSRLPEEVSQVPVEIVKWETPEESTEFAQMQDLGNMALLLPEDRIRTSTSTSQPGGIVPISSSTTTEQFPSIVSVPSVIPVEPECIRRQLPFCRGVLPYSETILPNWVGDNTEAERNFSVPYFEIIAESECHPRVQQYACAVLEPPCRGSGISLPPCRQFCRAIAEDCSSYVLSALTLASVLDCDQFPQSNDPDVCLNLASTTPEGECLPNEYRCNSDNTCIPERWVCDGRQDCSLGDDEFACSRCREEEFRCENENRCLPKRWRCDGSRDCADGSDERDCPSTQECGDGQFRCGDGLSCIPLRRVCDGSNHCRDNSDETNCSSIACQIEDFKCNDTGVCISRKWVCDGNVDCKDGSDEAQCAREAELNFESDVLIDEMEDPLAAGGNETAINADTTFNPDKCPLGELLCMSGSTCIRFEQLCDGTRDCADGADETDCGKPPGPE